MSSRDLVHVMTFCFQFEDLPKNLTNESSSVCRPQLVVNGSTVFDGVYIGLIWLVKEKVFVATVGCDNDPVGWIKVRDGQRWEFSLVLRVEWIILRGSSGGQWPGMILRLVLESWIDGRFSGGILVLGGILGGWTLLGSNPNSRFNRLNLRYSLNAVSFSAGTFSFPTWLITLLQSAKHLPTMNHRGHIHVLLSHFTRPSVFSRKVADPCFVWMHLEFADWGWIELNISSYFLIHVVCRLCSIGIQDPARTAGTTQYLAPFCQPSLTLHVDRAPSRIS